MPSEPIGIDAVECIVQGVTPLLRDRVKDEFEPHEGVYRLNDFGEYVSERDWRAVWSRYPYWAERVWMLADNGQYTAEDVGAMSVAQIDAAYDDPSFEPEYAFYTEADESGLL